jgi:hypothetical protein
MQMMILAMGLLSVFGLLSAPESFASTIVFLDKDGLVSFVNKLQSDSHEYRGSAKIASGDATSQPLQVEKGLNDGPEPSLRNRHIIVRCRQFLDIKRP